MWGRRPWVLASHGHQGTAPLGCGSLTGFEGPWVPKDQFRSVFFVDNVQPVEPNRPMEGYRAIWPVASA